MLNLMNSPENDILFANHSRRIEQVNKVGWMRSTSSISGADSEPVAVHAQSRGLTIKCSMIRLVGILAVVAGLILSGGSSLAAMTTVGLTECDHADCLVVTHAEVVASKRSSQAVSPGSASLPAGRFDPRFTR